MKITETIYIPDRKTWRKWLKKNYRKKTEIWLIYYRKKYWQAAYPIQRRV